MNADLEEVERLEGVTTKELNALFTARLKAIQAELPKKRLQHDFDANRDLTIESWRQEFEYKRGWNQALKDVNTILSKYINPKGE